MGPQPQPQTPILVDLHPNFSFRVFCFPRRKIKMMQTLIFVLLAVAGANAARLTSTGVDLEPIFLFLDDDASGGVDLTELKALTAAGDADGNGEVTAAEFQAAW